MIENQKIKKTTEVLPVEFWNNVKDEKLIYRHREKDILPIDVQVEMNKYTGNSNNLISIKAGDIIKGEIIQINKKQILIDFKYKDYIYVNYMQNEAKVVEDLKIGDMVDVLIVEVKQKPAYQILGSITELVRINVTKKLDDFFNDNLELNGTVIDIIPAGYLMDIDIDKIIVKAFMPNTLADVNKINNPEALIGKQMIVMLETLKQERGLYVVSHKKYLETQIPKKIKKLKKETQYTGVVTGVIPSALFIQFEGCLTGMLHIGNLVEEWRPKIMDIRPGTEVVFFIQDITKYRKIFLTQYLRESFWDTIKIDAEFKACEVLAIKDFGVLVKVSDEQNALIQKDNLKDKVVNAGDKVDLKVIYLDREARKVFVCFQDDKNPIYPQIYNQQRRFR